MIGYYYLDRPFNPHVLWASTVKGGLLTLGAVLMLRWLGVL